MGSDPGLAGLGVTGVDTVAVGLEVLDVAGNSLAISAVPLPRTFGLLLSGVGIAVRAGRARRLGDA
ncbi:MAG: hypothetical protein AB7Q81_10905 [Gammaproteobacteria bacterium]